MSVNKTVVIGTVLVGLSFSLQAASISNGNFDAEDVSAATFGFHDDAPTSWSKNTGGANQGGILDVGNVNTTAITSGQSNPNIAWVAGSSTFLSQAIGQSVANNLQVQLTFDVGTRADGAPQASDFVGGLFTTGGTALATATAADVSGGLSSGTVKTVTVNFNAGVGHLQNGNEIEIRLGTPTGGQIVFDDVNISAAVVPEPTTYALVSGLGLVGLAAYRRTRARKA